MASCFLKNNFSIDETKDGASVDSETDRKKDIMLTRPTHGTTPGLWRASNCHIVRKLAGANISFSISFSPNAKARPGEEPDTACWEARIRAWSYRPTVEAHNGEERIAPANSLTI